MPRPNTFVFDLDGCLLEHVGSLSECLRAAPKALPGAVELLNRLQSEGHHIVIMTGRPTTCRRRTEDQISYTGLVYHQLVMGVTGGVRVLINDNNGPEQRAYAIPMVRNCNPDINVRKWEAAQEMLANGP
jgi:ribonucleotide monophosphatase NagD (HAD superfamily)